MLLEHLGLAEPERFTFCLRSSVHTTDGFQDAIIQRNFDPITLQPSSSLNDTEWPISGPANTPFVLQTSTNLISWKSLATNSNDGSFFTYFQWFPASQQCFYRIAPD